MLKKGIKLKIGELKTDISSLKDLQISIGEVLDEDWAEAMGPTPYPSMTDLREWDRRLLERYKPFYMPLCDLCCLCTMGKCDLAEGKRGACGIDMDGQQSRIVLIACCIGAATHTGHARHLVEQLIEEYGRESPIDVGGRNVEVEAPVTRLVCGVRPKTLGDLEGVLDYLEKEVVHLLAATHTGQEGDNLDFESKVFHAGMIDQVGMEVADLAQISAYGFPRADPDPPLSELGFGSVDINKPVILVIGHNVPPAIDILDYVTDHDLYDKVEVCGICCSAHDMIRYNAKAKIVGPMSWQLRFVRSGVPDVIVVDEQCIRADILQEAQKINVPLITTVGKNCAGLPNRSNDQADVIVADLVEGREPGALILDSKLVGEVAVQTALKIAPKRSKFKIIPKVDELIQGAQKCLQCSECMRACPNNLPIPKAMAAAAQGDLSLLGELINHCIGCARCDSACPVKLPIHSYVVKANEKQLKEEKFKVRAGRGAIQDREIRAIGAGVVLGEIPGVIALVGCSNYPNGGQDVMEIAREFAKRRFIVLATGCAAMSIGMHNDEEGKTLYETNPSAFEAGSIINIGSCVSNPHIAGAAIKIASIFARRSLRANYEEIADYVLNRVGAVGVAWGAMSQKAASIASGFWRLGVPVVVGPHGIKYRRMLLGRKDQEEDWYVLDARTGKKVYVGPTPEHLFCTAENKEEAMVMIAKLCMRPNDTPKGRAIKLTHYIDLSKRHYGVIPDDVDLFVRTKSDVPITMMDEIMEILKNKGWKEKEIPDPTLLERLVMKKEEEGEKKQE